ELSRGKSLAAIQLGLASTIYVLDDAPAGLNDLDPLSLADPPSRHPADVAESSQGTAMVGDPKSKNASSPIEIGSSKSIYRPEWGVANGSLLDTPEAYQDLVDDVAPLGYFSELCHMYNEEFLRQYNVNLARQVVMGLQLRLRFEQEAKLLRKSVAYVARRDKRIQARELEIKKLKELLEDETNTKKAAKDKSVAGEEKLKAAFEEFKRQQDNRVEQRCAEIEARLDALSIDFDKELYPHMLTPIAGRRWVIGRGLRLTMMKCDESLELRQAFVDAVSARIAKGLKERDPQNPWACKEEMVLADAIAANISRAEKKKKCRIVCRTHGVGYVHHAQSDGVPVSMPTVVPQGLSLLLVDAATQTEFNT
nr:hypothetical protein [Tanacetum cinerariifolium]